MAVVDSSALGKGLDEIASATTAIDTAESALNRVVQIIKEARLADPTPVKFVGVIDNYRFTTGQRGVMPTHRFEVLCGNGLFLHVEATPEQFGNMMVDMKMGDITPTKVNNKLCVVERKREGGMVPVKMIENDPYPIQDKWGNFLWEGAYVQWEGAVCRVIGFKPNPDLPEYDAINIVFEDGDTGEKYANTLTLVL